MAFFIWTAHLALFSLAKILIGGVGESRDLFFKSEENCLCYQTWKEKKKTTTILPASPVDISSKQELQIQSVYQKDNFELERFLFDSPNPHSPNTYTQISVFQKNTLWVFASRKSSTLIKQSLQVIVSFGNQVSSLWIIWVLSFSVPLLHYLESQHLMEEEGKNHHFVRLKQFCMYWKSQ